jgi:hypothetical protein
MGSDKRLGYAFAASLLFNTACVAMVGTASLRHSRVPHGHDTSELHPTPLQMAEAKPLPANGQSEKPTDGSASDEEGTGKRGAGKAQEDKQKDEREQAGAGDRAKKRREEKRNRHQPLNARQKNKTADHPPAPNSGGVRIVRAVLATPSAAASLHALIAANKSVSSSRTGIPPKGMSVVTRPIIPGKNGHVGDRGNSVSPKMVKYPKAKLDLGTIHMTRPTHGVTGGGSADLRNVDIKVHYVVDDPNNKPKHLLADKIIKRFPTNCNGDPGNTSKCLATGGNTRLGGTTLHGRHDQITGVKYCVPGGGGIPSGGSGGSQSSAQAQLPGRNGRSSGKQSGSNLIISKVYHGLGSVSVAVSGRSISGPQNPDEPLARVINPLHLPAAHSDFHTLVPGAKVPEEDRKWVDNPEAHTDAAPPGVKLAALPRFSVSPRTVGSLSKFGTLNWGKPLKIRHKKTPYGGDGTGLLGMYYHGNAFNQPVFTRPDRNIDFDWSAGPPDPRIAPGTEYSVRWMGEIVPKTTDTYTLLLASDDGARLYLDGRLLIANWTVHSPSEDTITVRLEAGRHYALKLEYYENSAPPAVMKLYWEAPSVPREYIPESCLRYPITSGHIE